MRNLLWLPIDYPKLPNIDSLLEIDNLSETFAFWKFRRLTIGQDSAYAKTDWDPDIAKNYPELVSWFAGLPFLSLRNVKLNFQRKAVAGHIDFTNPHLELNLWNNNHINEPCGYRILIQGSRTHCLWVDDYTKLCDMPIETDLYVLNHTAGMHGVSNELGRWTIFCHAEIDSNKHNLLIQKSLIKYGQYAIWNTK
jgi:hypothetical protein